MNDDRVLEGSYIWSAGEIARAGILHLMEVAQSENVALMCAEEDPANCHRHHLLGRYLTRQGVNVLHIRPRQAATSSPR